MDGSLLVWVADFLDEYQPGAFRQAQVSFSSRIPNAIPIGDASTMSSNVSIFNSKQLLNINQILNEEMDARDQDEDRQTAVETMEDDEDKVGEEDEVDRQQQAKEELKEKLVSIVK